ncbi:cob(I)yrinic acid a,c-diamide adenosyltransferase [Patescibacteria group bacterium]|nr:cob(I)yrinic acid a,c-diamide adenosyltransferase [Patescibacteria group bacterium]
MSITTKIGDGGKSGLLSGERVSKGSLRLEAFGTVDELNAVLGVVLVEEEIPVEVKEYLVQVQKLLFRVGTDLATPLKGTSGIVRISQEDIYQIEKWIDELEQTLPVLKHFILPSGSRLSSLIHQARTVCRRAERCTVRLSEKEKINDHVQIYLNRLSDYLFLAAREANLGEGVDESEV